MGLKDVLLKKGWAGRTISRVETVSRLNPLIKQLTVLMHAYHYGIGHLSDRDLCQALEAQARTLRGDIGKLCETVYSCGGVAYSGVDLEPGDVNLGVEDAGMLLGLVASEETLVKALAEEKAIEHQMRTRAVLAKIEENGGLRIALLRTRTSTLRRN